MISNIEERTVIGNPNWPDKLRKSLLKHANEAVSSEVMRGSEQLPEMDEGNKSEWVKSAMGTLDRLVPDENKRYDIMAQCACDCVGEETISSLRKVWHETGDIDQLLDAMFGNPFLVRPVRDGDRVLFTKVAHDKAGFDKAESEFDKQRCYCHCDWVRATVGAISPTHCFCSAGWYRNIMEPILGRPVRITLVKSILQGDDCCVFAMQL